MCEGEERSSELNSSDSIMQYVVASCCFSCRFAPALLGLTLE